MDITKEKLEKVVGKYIPWTKTSLIMILGALGMMLFILFPGTVHAGGVSQAGKAIEDTFQVIIQYMEAAAGVAATVAGLWAGYQVLFGGETFRTMAPFFIGAVILAAVPWIVGLIFT
jgi:hypothetical protein